MSQINIKLIKLGDGVELLLRTLVQDKTLYYVGSMGGREYFRARFIQDQEFDTEHSFLSPNDVGFDLWRRAHLKFRRELKNLMTAPIQAEE